MACLIRYLLTTFTLVKCKPLSSGETFIARNYFKTIVGLRRVLRFEKEFVAFSGNLLKWVTIFVHIIN